MTTRKETGQSELLSTKFALPRLHDSLIPRDSLLTRLDDGYRRKLTLISAPAGFGKTTLVRAWIASLQHATVLAGWVSLDSGDNDPVRFWRYVITACRGSEVEAGANALAMLESPGPLAFEAILTSLINDLATLQGRRILVLEDYHVITTPRIHAAMVFLLDHLPPTLHVVIITRSAPPLPLGRLRARDELLELHTVDLRFTQDEIRSLLEQELGVSLPVDLIARLAARTEGWIAGLRIALLGLQGQTGFQDVAASLDHFSGSHRHILEYLTEEVLHNQSDPIQAFLLQTSFLGHLNGDLCDAVTGRRDSADVLEYLSQANLFLLPLDGDQRWYRYHGLFAEAMRHRAAHRLSETDLRSALVKASDWYERHDMLADAAEAALSARAFERAALLMERMIELQHFYGELYTLQRWVKQLPEALYVEHPALCFGYAISILFTSNRYDPATLARIETPLQLAEGAWRTTGNQEKLGEALALRSMIYWWQGEYSRGAAAAGQAAELLPENETYWRGISLAFIGVAEVFAGRIHSAEHIIGEARLICEASRNAYSVRATEMITADIYAREGALDPAARLFRKVLGQADDDISDAAGALIGLAALAYEWNDLDSAESDLQEALEIARQLSDDILTLRASLLLAKVYYARGERAAAYELVQASIPLARWPLLLREVQAQQAHFLLSDGDGAAVRRWYSACVRSGDDIPAIQREREALVAARMLIKDGETEAGFWLLNQWMVDARDHGRTNSEIEALILTALGYAADGQSSCAKSALVEALHLAQPGSYRRLFLDEGPALAVLLRVTLPDLDAEPLITYARSLLYAFSRQAQASTAVAAPISPQETRVLRLLAAGLSNPEIADELIVSINTIKTQIKSIYRKLNVSNREEASTLAQQLKLI